MRTHPEAGHTTVCVMRHWKDTIPMIKRRVVVFPEAGIAIVPLGSTEQTPLYALIDAEDAERVQEHNWYAKRPGSGGHRYATTSIKRSHIRMHRFIVDAPDGMDVDHINHNTLDNRRCNLRVVDHTVNLHNARRKPSKPGKRHVGVYRQTDARRRNPWRARITVDGKVVNLGSFATEEEAARAYDEAVQNLRDPLAFRNFSEGQNRPS